MKFHSFTYQSSIKCNVNLKLIWIHTLIMLEFFFNEYSLIIPSSRQKFYWNYYFKSSKAKYNKKSYRLWWVSGQACILEAAGASEEKWIEVTSGRRIYT